MPCIMFMPTMTTVINGMISYCNHYLVLSPQILHETQRKKENFTQIADVEMPKKPHETGNLRKVLQLKVGAKIRLNKY